MLDMRRAAEADIDQGYLVVFARHLAVPSDGSSVLVVSFTSPSQAAVSLEVDEVERERALGHGVDPERLHERRHSTSRASRRGHWRPTSRSACHVSVTQRGSFGARQNRCGGGA